MTATRGTIITCSKMDARRKFVPCGATTTTKWRCRKWRNRPLLTCASETTPQTYHCAPALQPQGYTPSQIGKSLSSEPKYTTTSPAPTQQADKQDFWEQQGNFVRTGQDILQQPHWDHAELQFQPTRSMKSNKMNALQQEAPPCHTSGPAL